MSEEYDHIFKMCILGGPGIGKESFVKSFIEKGFFSEAYKRTVGVDFHVKIITIDTHEGPLRIKLQVWDIGGEEKFRDIRPMFFRGAFGYILFFDLTNRESFLHLSDYIKLITESKKKRKKEQKAPLLLIGNKSDPEKFAISPKELDDFIRKYNLYYMEISTITKEEVLDSFYCLTSLMVGVGIHSEYFSSDKVIYRPSINPPPTSTSIPTLTSQDLHNLSQQLITLEKKLDGIKPQKGKISKQLVPQKRILEKKVRPSSDIGHQVFICSSNNDKDIANATCHFLEQEGIKCWIAPRDVSVGSYASSIVEAIETSKLMVLIFTNNANLSNHVKRELELAVSNGLTIQPIRTEAVEPSSELKYYLSSMHWLDALTPPLEDHLSKLAKKVSQLLDVI